MPDIQKTLAFDQTEIKFIGDGSKGTFEGYASVFNNTDADGDIILPGAFAGVIANQSRKVAMFFNHQTRAIPVGKWDAMHEDDKGLFVRGQLTPGLSLAEDLKAAMQHGTVEGMSVGFSVGPDDYTVGTSGLIFKNISYLREISVCTFPANELAGVTAMKHRHLSPVLSLQAEASSVATTLTRWHSALTHLPLTCGHLNGVTHV